MDEFGNFRLPITILHPITRLIVGGAQQNTIDIAVYLDKSIFRSEILCGPQIGSEGSLIETVNNTGIPLTLVPELIREISPINDIRALRKLYMAMRRSNPTIVHTHSSKAGILGRLAARMARVPVIIHTIHGWGFHDFMPDYQRIFYIFLERFLSRFTHALIAVSKHDISIGLRNGIGSIDQYHLIRSAIQTTKINPEEFNSNLTRAELGIPSDSTVIGTINRLSPQKNPLDWIEIAGLIHRSYPEVFFLIVGDGPLRPQVEQAVQKLDISERIIITGIRSDIQKLLSTIDIFMTTSLWEGLPRTVLQALIMNKPVVAYEVGGIPEVVINSETGFLSQPRDINEMAEHCIQLILNPYLCAKFGKNGAGLVQDEFDLTKMIGEISNLYKKLIANST